MTATLVGCEGGRLAGEFAAPRSRQRLARVVLVYVTLTGAVTMARGLRPAALVALGEANPLVITLPLFCVALAAVGAAIRAAHLRVGDGAVSWGWGEVGFRLGAAELREARVYRDAVAVVRRRGLPWYLSRRDWEPFADLGRAFRDVGVPVVERSTAAPLLARLQGYGWTLDVLLLLAAAASSVIALAVL